MFDRGARPVIYQLSSQSDILPKELGYLHQTHDPVGSSINFLWEIERRIKWNVFCIEEVGEPIVLVESNEEYYDLLSHFSNENKIFQYPITTREMLLA